MYVQFAATDGDGVGAKVTEFVGSVYEVDGVRWVCVEYHGEESFGRRGWFAASAASAPTTWVKIG